MSPTQHNALIKKMHVGRENQYSGRFCLHFIWVIGHPSAETYNRNRRGCFHGSSFITRTRYSRGAAKRLELDTFNVGFIRQ